MSGSSLRSVTPLPGNLSWKAILAVVVGAVVTALLTALEQFADITIDPTAKVAIVGAVVALFSGAGAYAGNPPQTVPTNPNPRLEEHDLHDSMHDRPGGV